MSEDNPFLAQAYDAVKTAEAELLAVARKSAANDELRHVELLIRITHDLEMHRRALDERLRHPEVETWPPKHHPGAKMEDQVGSSNSTGSGEDGNPMLPTDPPGCSID